MLEQGVQFLNEQFGEDWPSRIDLDTLDIASGDDCVGGQLCGNDFAEFMSQTGKNLSDLAALGFYVPYHGDFDDAEEVTKGLFGAYARLTEDWKSVIKELQDA